MSCRVGDTLVAGSREAEFSVHRVACADCAGLSRRMDDLESLSRSLAVLPLPPVLRASLLEIPSRTVSCEGADALLALALENEIAPSDEGRWSNHLSRCTACSEAAQALFATRGLAAPVPAPWLATRLGASRPASSRKERSRFFALIWSPKGAVALAYAAAVAVMLSGFDPADLARKAGMARLEHATGAAVAAARASAVERIGALEEKAYRSFMAFTGRVAGYSRATLANALSLVMRTEQPRPPDRPKSGEGRDVPTNDDGVRLAGNPEPGAAPNTGWRT